MGVDPGTTVGLAIVDLQGRLLHLSSKKHISDKELFEKIFSYGVPIIVATDVFPPPGKVVQIASSLGAKLWYPRRSLSVQEKDEIARKFSYGKLGPQNDHERDALAAAYSAFAAYSSKFRQVEHKLREIGREDAIEEAKRAVVFGRSVDSVLRQLSSETVATPRRAKKRERHRLPEEVKELLEEREFLLRRISELEQENEELRWLLSRVKRRDDEILEMEKRTLTKRINELQQEIARLREELKRVKELAIGLGKGKYRLVEKRTEGVIAELEGFFIVPADTEEKIKEMLEEYRRRRARIYFK